MDMVEPMKHLSQWIAAVWIVTALLIAAPLYLVYDREVRAYLDGELLQMQAAFRSTEAVFRTQTNQAFSDLLLRDGMRQLLREVEESATHGHAVAQRHALIDAGSHTHRTLRTCCGAALHVLDADGHSLVRFEVRGEHGTDLAELRPGLARIIEGRHGAQGFEIGSTGPAYRRILPVWKDGRRVGVLEASLQPGDLTALLHRVSGNALLHHVLIRADVLADFSSSSAEQVVYRETRLNPALLEPLQPGRPSSRLAHWLEESTVLRASVREALPNAEPVQELTNDPQGRQVAVIMAPVADFNERHIGYAVAESDAGELIALRNQVFGIGLIMFLLAGSLGSVAMLLIRARQGTAALQQKLAAVTESVGEGVYVVGDNGRIRYINQAACDMLGYARQDLVGADARAVFHVDKWGNLASTDQCKMWQVTRSGEAYRSDEERFRTSSGRLVPVSLTSTQLRNSAGSGSRMVVVFHDISERVREISTLKTQAMRDPLTGLANRRLFDERLHQELLRSRRTGATLTLLMADVDSFKLYNDTFGHPAGDLALQRIARVLEQCAKRPSDLVCRYGGEEFAVLLPEADAEAANQIAERIREKVRQASIDQADADGTAVVTISVGVATAVSGSPDAAQLLAIADAALYRAKSQGGNQVEYEAAS